MAEPRFAQRPESHPGRRTARRPVLRPRRGPLPATSLEQHPIFATYVGHPHATTSSDDGTRDAVEPGDRRRAAAPGRDRGDRPGRPLGERPLRARARDPQPPPRALRHRGPPRLGAPLDGAWTRSATRSSRLRPRLRPARRAARLAGCSARGRSDASRAARTRATAPQVRLWQELELDAGEQMPGLFDEIMAAGHGRPRRARAAPPRQAVETATAAVVDVPRRLKSSAWATPSTTGRWAPRRYDELVGLRAFDGLDADADPRDRPASSWPRNKAARVADAREIDPSVDEPIVVDRIKSQPPGDLRRSAGRPTATR